MSCADCARVRLPRAVAMSASAASALAAARSMSSCISGISSSASSWPGTNTVADIDANRLDIASLFRHHVDFLIRNEFTGQHQVACQIAARHS